MEKFVPSSAKGDEVKFLAVSAHKDDMEMFAFDGIVRAARGEGGFVGVVLTDGGQCPRAPQFAGVSDEDMAQLRTAEQKRAAEAGGYSALYLFEQTSSAVKKRDKALVDGVTEILESLPRLDVLYTHNPFDRHPTHVGAFCVAMDAVRRLPDDKKPLKIYGCEVWRDLDWLPDEVKVEFDVSGEENFAAELMSSFVTQNAVKRYDIAALARRKAHATFGRSHEGDTSTGLIYAVDMTSLAYGDDADTEAFVRDILARFDGDLHRIWNA